MDLIINKPIVKNNRLISKIEYDGKNYNMYFEVNEEYKDFLCEENSDAFLVSLLPFIVKHEYNVIIKNSISSKLYYQLNSYLLPLLCKTFKKKNINITTKLSNYEFNSKGVGASISCGVDSFYTLFKHKNLKDQSYNITHLTFFNAGSHGAYGGEKSRKLFYERLENIRTFCEKYNYKLVTVDSNMNELIMMNHEKTHTFRTLGCVLALQKLFSKYYFASGLTFDGSHIDENDTAFYDILNVQCLSNQNTIIYCSGLEATRMEKVKFISEYSETYEWLNVCISDKKENCCECPKCIRTMTALESIDKLDKYSKVFDLTKYEKNKTKIYTELYKMSSKRQFAGMLYEEIIDSYKNNKKKLPFKSYILSKFPNIKDLKMVLKKILPKSIVNKLKKDKTKSGWCD